MDLDSNDIITITVALGGYAIYQYGKTHAPQQPQNPTTTTNGLAGLSQPLTPSAPALPAPQRLSIDQLKPIMLPNTANPYSEWKKIVQLDPNTPHVLLHGTTGDGKTYTASGLCNDRDGNILVIDPNYRRGNWPGVPVVTCGRGTDYEPINRALASILRELDERGEKFQRGIDSPEVTVIADEVPLLNRRCSLWGEFFQRVAMEARKYNIRLICMSQSTRVNSLGIAGFGQTLDNFAVISLGKFAHDIAGRHKFSLADVEHVAVMEWRGRYYELDLSEMPALNARKNLAGRRFVPRGVKTIT